MNLLETRKSLEVLHLTLVNLVRIEPSYIDTYTIQIVLLHVDAWTEIAFKCVGLFITHNRFGHVLLHFIANGFQAIIFEFEWMRLGRLISSIGVINTFSGTSLRYQVTTGGELP